MMKMTWTEEPHTFTHHATAWHGAYEITRPSLESGYLVTYECHRDSWGGVVPVERVNIGASTHMEFARELAEEHSASLGTDPREVITIDSRIYGRVTLHIRSGFVIGAMGCEPSRYMGLTLAKARRLACPRTTHVECDDAAGYNWLCRNVRGAVHDPDGSFLVHDDAEFAACLRAAGGRIVQPARSRKVSAR